jgi:hypothetical protein
MCFPRKGDVSLSKSEATKSIVWMNFGFSSYSCTRIKEERIGRDNFGSAKVQAFQEKESERESSIERES